MQHWTALSPGISAGGRTFAHSCLWLSYVLRPAKRNYRNVQHDRPECDRIADTIGMVELMGHEFVK